MFLNDMEIAGALRSGIIRIEILQNDGSYRDVDIPSDAELFSSLMIQASSIDLTIGKLFIPPKKTWPKNEIPTEVQYETGFQLEPGQTAVVETQEKLVFSRVVGAFGFPPAGVSKNSILMTNPGHVDPGYEGHLTFTIINMGRRPFSLLQGKRIASLLVYKLEKEAKFGYAERHQIQPPNRVELLQQLSPDFGALSERMQSVAKLAIEERTATFEKQINDAKSALNWSQIVIPAMAALIAAFVGYKTTEKEFATVDELKKINERVDNLDNRFGTSEIRIELERLKTRLQTLEKQPGQ